MARFTLPRDLYHGKGSLEALKTFTGKKAIVCVGGGSMKRFGFLDRAVGYLKEAGMEVELFEGIEPDPSVETVMRGAEAMLKFEPDWIIAMGGGSPIDAAKAMWIKYEYPDITFEEMCKVFGIVALTHHVEAVIAKLSVNIVLVNLHEQPFEVCDPLLIPGKLLLQDSQLFGAFHPKLLLHDLAEVVLMTEDVVRHPLNMA